MLDDDFDPDVEPLPDDQVPPEVVAEFNEELDREAAAWLAECLRIMAERGDA